MSESHRTSNISNCGMIDLPRHEDPNGQLTEVENTRGAKMHIRRVFYLYDVPANSERGGHSHHHAEELIIAVSGSFNVTVDDGHRKCTYTLDRPYNGLYIESGIWRTLDNFSAGSVCLVLTTERYDEADYVRCYDDFKHLTECKNYVDNAEHQPDSFVTCDLDGEMVTIRVGKGLTLSQAQRIAEIIDSYHNNR